MGGVVESAIHAVSLGTVDLRKKEKQQQMELEEAKHDKDVQNKRIKTRQNIFNLAGVKGEELEKGEIKSGTSVFSA